MACGGRSDVRMCMCARRRRHTHTHTYGTAKETEQMMQKIYCSQAPNVFKYDIFYLQTCIVS